MKPVNECRDQFKEITARVEHRDVSSPEVDYDDNMAFVCL
jgi:hypothetical protein